MKRVIFFCYGDSSKPSTWSNVPYCFTKTLIDIGYDIIRIDISPNRYVNRIFNILISNPLRLLFPNSTYCYIRSRVFKYRVDNIIKKAIIKNNENQKIDLCIFSCFDFYNSVNNIPTILLSDWTYEILIKERLKRNPYKFERCFIKQQSQAINKADLVISLFPACAESMKMKFPHANIHYLGSNVVNVIYKKEAISKEIIHRKIASKSIIFIGDKQYTNGALKLIKAIEIINKGRNGDSRVNLNIIGLKDKDIKIKRDFVHCHGYLNKDIETENELYYKLLLEACIFVNPTPIWGGYSSTVEAMYFYTPIIISPYKDFVKEFGPDIEFGRYNESFNEKCIAENILSIINMQNTDYNIICEKAHNAVKNYTWDVYITKMLNLINNKI